MTLRTASPSSGYDLSSLRRGQMCLARRTIAVISRTRASNSFTTSMAFLHVMPTEKTEPKSSENAPLFLWPQESQAPVPRQTLTVCAAASPAHRDESIGDRLIRHVDVEPTLPLFDLFVSAGCSEQSSPRNSITHD